MLTPKQRELLLFINNHLTEYGISPSFDEMRDALGLRSKSGIHRLIHGLEERGFIKRMPQRARALEVIRLPESAARHHAEPPPSFAPRIIQGNFSLPASAPTSNNDVSSIMLPLLGQIAAGMPIEALRDHNNIEAPRHMIGHGEHFALEVKGDSMIDAGILEGDTIIMRKSDIANNGDVIVAFIDDTDVTLKRFRRKGATIALEAANKRFGTQIYGPGRIKIQGVLVGLMRTY